MERLEEYRARKNLDFSKGDRTPPEDEELYVNCFECDRRIKESNAIKNGSVYYCSRMCLEKLS